MVYNQNMFGKMNSFEQAPKKPEIPQATPEQILAAMKAADVVAREKAEMTKKTEAERLDAKRIEKLWLEKEGAEKGPYVITAEDVKDAEKAVGKKFEQLN